MDAERWSHEASFEAIEALGYSCALRPETFCSYRTDIPAITFETPSDIEREIHNDRGSIVTLRIVNARHLFVPMYLRAAAQISSAGLPMYKMYNRVMERLIRFHLETRLGLFSLLVQIEVCSDTAPPNRLHRNTTTYSILRCETFVNCTDFMDRVNEMIELSETLRAQRNAFWEAAKSIETQLSYRT